MTQQALLIAVILLAFGVRLRALTRFQFHIDEFYTLAASRFIAESGLPRYPTGLIYDPGLPFSYLDGALFWLLGFNEALGRWPAVLFGVLAVVTVYWLGARALRSPGAGLLAAFWLAVSLESVEWSGRARMTTLAQWLALLSMALLWLGLTRPSSRYRLAFAASNGLTLLTHFATVVLMPAWFVSTALLVWARAVRLSRALLRDAAVLLAVFGLAIASGIFFQPPPSPEFDIGSTRLGDKTEELGGKFLDIPSDVGHAWEAYSPYFLPLPHGPLLLLALAGIGVSAKRLARRQPQRRDLGALFLGGIFITVMLTLALVIDTHWQRSRYLVMQVQGVFLLLGAHGLGELARWQAGLWRRFFKGDIPLRPSAAPLHPWAPRLITGLLVVGASLPFLPPLANLMDDSSDGWNRYDLAFAQVQEELSEGDRVMSMHPPASLLYLDQSDFYLVQSSSSPKLIERADGQLGDRYSGAIWVDTAEQFNQRLAEPGRIWLVAQEFWLFNSYDGFLQQQILFQMERRWGEGGVWALVSRPGAWPLAREMDIPLEAEFEGGGRLLGYTANPPAPGGVVYLTLFWQGQELPIGGKIFVHLRNDANDTVAQADHFIFNGKVPVSRWSSLVEQDPIIRDGAALQIPADLPPGNYRLLVGFYHPETFQRLPVINDQSGENAAILGEWSIP